MRDLAMMGMDSTSTLEKLKRAMHKTCDSIERDNNEKAYGLSLTDEELEKAHPLLFHEWSDGDG